MPAYAAMPEGAYYA